MIGKHRLDAPFRHRSYLFICLLMPEIIEPKAKTVSIQFYRISIYIKHNYYSFDSTDFSQKLNKHHSKLSHIRIWWVRHRPISYTQNGIHWILQQFNDVSFLLYCFIHTWFSNNNLLIQWAYWSKNVRGIHFSQWIWTWVWNEPCEWPSCETSTRKTSLSWKNWLIFQTDFPANTLFSQQTICLHRRVWEFLIHKSEFTNFHIIDFVWHIIRPSVIEYCIEKLEICWALLLKTTFRIHITGILLSIR